MGLVEQLTFFFESNFRMSQIFPKLINLLVQVMYKTVAEFHHGRWQAGYGLFNLPSFILFGFNRLFYFADSLLSIDDALFLFFLFAFPHFIDFLKTVDEASHRVSKSSRF